MAQEVHRRGYMNQCNFSQNRVITAEKKTLKIQKTVREKESELVNAIIRKDLTFK